VDHDLLLEKFWNLGIRGDVKEWLSSYLRGRSQKVLCNRIESAPAVLDCGVPQGSVLGPLLFTIFISDISTVLSKHSVKYVAYADDIQIFTSSSPRDIASTLLSLETCVADIHKRLSSQKLLLNPKKTEFIIISSKHHSSLTKTLSIRIDDHVISASTVVRDLGVFLDSELTFSDHIKRIRRQCFMQLRLISKLRRFMSKKHAALLINALVFSKMNFCISLLFGLPKKQLIQLQPIIHYGIRIVERLKKQESITNQLRNLGWLDVETRAKYRLCQIVHSALESGKPEKIASLLKFQTSTYGLRSETDMKLVIPRVSKSIGKRAFSVAGPSVYNDIPFDIRSLPLRKFKQRLLSHLL
jgi:hypothetical protein